MATVETVSVGSDGDVPIPQSVRHLTGIDAGSIVTLEARKGVIVIRPVSENAEVYSLERKAEFLLSNAVDAADYAAACDEVRRMGLDPDKITRQKPKS